MKVILLKDVTKLGRRFDVKEVSHGYASNYLFPNKIAEHATDAKLKSLQTQIAKHISEVKVTADLLAKNLESLKNISIEIVAKANEKGHLFKGLKETDIMAALKEQGHVELEPGMIVLEAPIKANGDYEIVVQSGDVKGSFKLSVRGES